MDSAIYKEEKGFECGSKPFLFVIYTHTVSAQGIVLMVCYSSVLLLIHIQC